MLAGEFGVARDRSRQREVEIALEGYPQRAAGCGELVEADVPELRFPEPTVAETKGELRAVGGEELNDGFEVDGLILAVDGGALGAAVLEEFLALGGRDETHGFNSCLGDPSGSFAAQTDRASFRAESNAAHQCPIRTDRGSTGCRQYSFVGVPLHSHRLMPRARRK
jgi:hypothetical protein